MTTLQNNGRTIVVRVTIAHAKRFWKHKHGIVTGKRFIGNRDT